MGSNISKIAGGFRRFLSKLFGGKGKKTRAQPRSQNYPYDCPYYDPHAALMHTIYLQGGRKSWETPVSLTRVVSPRGVPVPVRSDSQIHRLIVGQHKKRQRPPTQHFGRAARRVDSLSYVY